MLEDAGKLLQEVLSFTLVKIGDQSITVADPEGWWNPFRPNSFGTAVTQRGLALTIFFTLNTKLNRLQEKAP